MIKYLFSINTGRSGSKYLSRVFQHVEHTIALHEPEPIMNKEIMRDYLMERDSSRRKTAVKEKLESIQTYLGDKKLYVETNHVFVKGFGWDLPNYLNQEEIGVVLIHRDKEKIANSLYRINCSPINDLGQDWVITPVNTKRYYVPIKIKFPRLKYYLYRYYSAIFSKNNRIIKNYEINALKWYVEELWHRAELYKQKFPKIKYFETTLEELNDIATIERMFEYFQIPKEYIKPTIHEQLGAKVNEKKSSKRGL